MSDLIFRLSLAPNAFNLSPIIVPHFLLHRHHDLCRVLPVGAGHIHCGCLPGSVLLHADLPVLIHSQYRDIGTSIENAGVRVLLILRIGFLCARRISAANASAGKELVNSTAAKPSVAILFMVFFNFFMILSPRKFIVICRKPPDTGYKIPTSDGHPSLSYSVSETSKRAQSAPGISHYKFLPTDRRLMLDTPDSTR